MEKLPSKKLKKNNGDAVWQVDCKELCQQNIFLLEHGEMSDCTFLVGKPPNTKSFACHKLLLGKASPVFAAMLFRPLSDDNKGVEVCKVEDVEPEIFKILINHIYTNCFDWVSIESCFKLSCVAEFYILPSLQQLTYNNLLLTMNPGNAIQVYELSKDLSTQVAKKIEQRSRKMMVEYTDEVLEDCTFNQADHSTVLMIAKQDTLNVNEANLILACEKWAEKEAQRLQLEVDTAGLIKALGDIFNHLRFLALTIKDLDTIEDCKLISNDKKLKLRKRINSTKLTFQFFDEFCTDECPRNLVQIVPPNFTFTDEKSNYDCNSTNCKNYTTINGNGFIYSVKFEVDSNIALLGIKYSKKLSTSSTVKWSVILTDELNTTYDTGRIYERSYLMFHNTIIIPCNKTFTLIVIAKDNGQENEEENISEDQIRHVTMKAYGIALPKSNTSLVQSIIYGKF